MNKINDGGPAFAYGNHEQGGYSGMSLRDWFAGQALVGIVANPGNNDGQGGAAFAGAAYMMADAMIEARAAQGGEA